MKQTEKPAVTADRRAFLKLAGVFSIVAFRRLDLLT